MQTIGEFFASFWLFFKVKLFFLRESRKVRRRFPEFLPCEKAFKKAYRFKNPFTICKTFLRKRGETLIDAYGETPLSVFAQIAQEFHLSKQDVVIEMGCGRGVGAVFLSSLVGCRVIGVDWVPFFIETAQSLSRTAFSSLPVTFRCEQMHFSDFSQATAIYLYGTCLPDEDIVQLAHKLESLPSPTKIITVSYPLSDYSKNFRTIKQFNASFPWGEGDVYLQEPLHLSL